MFLQKRQKAVLEMASEQPLGESGRFGQAV